MIKPGEIQKKSRAVGVRDQQIEKDYILSWILQGFEVTDIEIDLNKLKNYCEIRGIKNNGKARSQFVQAK